MIGVPTRHRGVWLLSHLFGLILFCLLTLPAAPCPAQFSPRDGQIIARTLSFIEASTGGTIEIGIAYAPDRPGSVSQAESLRAAIGDALAAGKVTLKARMIPVDRLQGASGIAGIFVTGELGS